MRYSFFSLSNEVLVVLQREGVVNSHTGSLPKHLHIRLLFLELVTVASSLWRNISNRGPPSCLNHNQKHLVCSIPEQSLAPEEILRDVQGAQTLAVEALKNVLSWYSGVYSSVWRSPGYSVTLLHSSGSHIICC